MINENVVNEDSIVSIDLNSSNKTTSTEHDKTDTIVTKENVFLTYMKSINKIQKGS